MDEIVEAMEKYKGLVPLVYDDERQELDEAKPNEYGYAVYLKHEADAVIRHQKFMRCNLLIDYCGLKQNTCQEEKVPFWRKWYFRWCELSDKFKEVR